MVRLCWLLYEAVERYISLFSCVFKISLFYPHLQLTFQVIFGCWFMLPNYIFLYEHLWSAGASLLLNVQWAAMGKPGHFCCLLFFFNPGGNYLVYCYCLLPCEHHRAQHLCFQPQLVAAQSHPLPVPLYLPLQALQFLFFAGFWIITELPTYKSWLTGCLFTRNTSQYIVDPANLESTFVSTVCDPMSSFLLFSSKTSHSKGDVISNLHYLIFRWISLFLAMNCYWIPPELF